MSAQPPADPAAAVAHLRPEHWEPANRLLVRKALAELSHERLLAPRRQPDGTYAVGSDDGSVEYRFAARVLALDHWQVDAGTIQRLRGGVPQPLDALEFVLDLRETLDLSDQVLPTYLEEVTGTLAASAFRLATPDRGAAELARSGYQTIEAGMSEGHPCFVANGGRVGFDAADHLAYAPEAARPVRLLWVAARRDRTTQATGAGPDHDRLIRSELDAGTLARFARTAGRLGLDLDGFALIPVHPWQWWNRLAVTLAGDVARRDLVCLGSGADEYLPQQSVRTFFNATDPSKHYVKTALSVLNMGFVRGMSAGYMAATPAINDWVGDLVARDPVLARARFGILRERAAVGYRSPAYEAAAPWGSPYRKLLAALWRESPVPGLAPGERLATMAALLHVDRAGRSVVGALIAGSGLPARTWLRRYLDAYLVPVLHCFYAYDLVFMPHGENVILVLEGDVPRRVLLKDIAEEVAVLDPAVPLPPGIERIRMDVPEELRALSIFTDVFDCFLRFLAAILATGGELDEDAFWGTVAACVAGYQRSAPDLARRFARYDLFAESFPLSCLNRLQLRDNQQMVDLQDPAGSLVLAGSLANPLAAFRPTAH